MGGEASDETAGKAGGSKSEDGGRPAWLRYLPIAVLVAGAAFAWFRYGDYLSFETLAEHHDALVEWRDANWLLAACAYLVFYALMTAFSVPGAIWVTIAGGLMFGTAWGAGLTVVAATIGACGIFLAARTSLGRFFKDRAGKWMQRVRDEFEQGEVTFLLVIRLVPVMPFFVANLLPAFLNARFFNFFWTTAVGIAPATVVFTSIGAGLGTEISEGEAPDLGVIFEPHIILPLLGLAALATIPLIVRKFRNRKA